MARHSDAISTREHRELFQRAIRDGVTMEEARRRQSAERWAHTDARLASRRAAPLHDSNEERAALLVGS